MTVSAALKPLRAVLPRYVGQSPDDAALAGAAKDRQAMNAPPPAMYSKILRFLPNIHFPRL
jgi:hypothetical protein